jgi:hypothetical protein
MKCLIKIKKKRSQAVTELNCAIHRLCIVQTQLHNSCFAGHSCPVYLSVPSASSE